MKKKILLSIIILTIAFSAGIALKTKAGTGDSGTGWLWGGGAEDDGGASPPTPPWDGTNTNVGWINMNCNSLVDSDSSGFIDTGDEPMKICSAVSNADVRYKWCNGSGIVCTGGTCVDACTVRDYGVKIPTVGNGPVTGYAWSENLGYINFAPAGPYPAAPNNSVVRNGNDLEGWARFEEIRIAGGNSGGWDGWIKMKGVAADGSLYGVSIIPATGALTGFASAGGNELGWIDFRQASIVVPKTLKICAIDCNNGGPALTTISINESTTRNLKACYNTETTCIDVAGTADVTIAADWAETADPNDAIGLTDTDTSPEVLNANAVDADRTASFSVVHNTDTVNVTVNVNNIAVCGDGVIEGFEECDDGAANGPCPASCSASCTCNDCSGSSSWREVAP